MARMNLRPIYDQDEVSGGSRIASAIQGALGSYAQHQEIGQQEESRRRAAGQVMTQRGEGGIDRLRDLGRRLLRRPDPAAPAGALAPSPDWSGTPKAPTARIIPPSMAVDATVPPDNPVFGTSTAPSATPLPPVRVTPNRAVATSAAPTATPETRARTIGSALDAYTENDNFGNQWTVDPNRDANRRLAADHAELMQKDDMTHQDDEEKIASLVAAGMPAGEARARVLNNVVKYDTEFGQQFRPGTGGTSQTDWMARENLRQQHRLQMEQAHKDGKITSAQLAQERLALQREEFEDRKRQNEEKAQAGGVTRDLGIAARLGDAIPKDGITLATQTEEQKAATQKATRERDARVKSAASASDRLKNRHATQAEAAAYYAKLPSTLTHEQKVAQMKAAGFP